jgi:hypothetical protein
METFSHDPAATHGDAFKTARYNTRNVRTLSESITLARCFVDRHVTSAMFWENEMRRNSSLEDQTTDRTTLIRPMGLYAMLTLSCSTMSCGATEHTYQASGLAPPSLESAALCGSICQKAACPGPRMDSCLADCAEEIELACEFTRTRTLACLQRAHDVQCDERGIAFAPSCQYLRGRHYQCLFRQ